MQDIALCKERYPMAICRPIALQFSGENGVSLLELAVREENDALMLNIIDEKHYLLIPQSEISNTDLITLKNREGDYVT